MLRCRGQMESVQGEIERVVFTSEDSGFTVLRITVSGRRQPVTAVGKMPGVREGETIKVEGRWKQDAKFGEQLDVERFETVLPQTEEGIRSYLASGMVHGIGPKLAERIVGRFGVKTLDVLDHAPERLGEVDGIGRVKVDSLKKSWAKQSEIRSVMVFLQGNGVSPAYATRIYKRYGPGAARIVSENPYRLAEEVSGIGFKTADLIARKVGIAEDSPARMDAGVRFVLGDAASDGHCFLPPDDLAKRATEALGEKGTTEAIEAAVARLSEAKAVIVEDGNVFQRELHEAETAVGKRLRALLGTPARLAKPLDAPKALAWVEQQTSRSLAVGQREAVVLAAGGKVTVITGGPGTGKTTVVDALCRIVRARHERVLLAAPTGRAAKRLAEATGLEAKTVHRLLEFDPRSGVFVRDSLNRLDGDVLVLDECSMIDLPLFCAILAAVPDGARLVLVGDADQLPSVGPGNVLHDVIESRAVPVARLTEIFRQAALSGIVANAHRVNAGQEPSFSTPRSLALAQTTRSVEGPAAGAASSSISSEDFFFVARDEPEEAVQTVCDLVADRIPRKWGLDPAADIQVLVPMNRGAAGATTLNAALQARINPKGREVQAGPRRFRIGDRVLQMRNDYDKEVFNGDLGRVTGFDDANAVLEVTFDGRVVLYPSEDADELQLAYASTIHRSQGSEYPAVVIPILTQHFVMLQRNLLYTAITRGKRLVVLVGSKKAIGMAVRNHSGGARWTALAERLRRTEPQ